ILCTKRVFSLTELRLMELFLFGLCVAVASFFDYTDLSETHFMVQNPGSEGMLADQRALIWVLLIVAYGIFIPNTWRRCALSVGVMALMPLVVGAAGGLSNPNIPQGSLFWYLT